MLDAGVGVRRTAFLLKATFSEECPKHARKNVLKAIQLIYIYSDSVKTNICNLRQSLQSTSSSSDIFNLNLMLPTWRAAYPLN